MSKQRSGWFLRSCGLFIILAQLFLHQVFALPYDIKRDESVEGVQSGGTEYNFFHYSSVAVFDGQETTTFGNDVLAGMAKKAWGEMRDHAVEADQEENMPNVMSALAVGDRVYFASSIKGGHGTPFFNHIQGMGQALVKTILDCRPLQTAPNVPNRHRYDANCGEMMGMYLYFQDPDAPPKPTPNQPRAVMVAVGITPQDAEAGIITIWNACSATANAAVGCENILATERSWLRWVRQSEVRPEDNTPEPDRTYNLQLKCN